MNEIFYEVTKQIFGCVQFENFDFEDCFNLKLLNVREEILGIS